MLTRVRATDGAVVALVMQRRSSAARGSIVKKFYELPKGHVEGEESLEQAAARELEEETGLSDPSRGFGTSG